MCFWARKSVVLQELNRQAKRQVALTAATGVAVRRNQLLVRPNVENWDLRLHFIHLYSFDSINMSHVWRSLQSWF